MKRSVWGVGGLIFISICAVANGLPKAEYSKAAKIEGDAAKILYDSLLESPEPISEKYSFVTSCGGTVKQGKIHFTQLGSGKSVKIICSTYFCEGFQGVCHLEEDWTLSSRSSVQ